LAARFDGGAVVVWNLETRKPVVSINAQATNSILSDLAFSPDSKRVIFTDAKNRSKLSVFDAATGLKLSSGSHVGHSFFRLRPDEKQVAKVARGGVELEDYPNGTNVQILPHVSPVNLLVWAPDGNRLATSCEDGEVYIWDLLRGTHRDLHGHTERGVSLGFSPDGTRFFSSSRDGTTRVWNVSDGYTIASAVGIGRSFNPDGSRIGFARALTGFGTWRLFCNTNYRLLDCPRSEGPLLTLDLSPSGRWCVATQNKGFRIWDLSAGDRESYVAMLGFHCVRISADEHSLFICRDTGLQVWPLTNYAAGDLESEAADAKWIPLPDARGAQAVAPSLDGRSAAVELTDRRLVVLDLAGERAPVILKNRWRTASLKGPASLTGAGRFAISPDGRWVVTGFDFGAEDVPCVWDARSGELVTKLDADTSLVAFSPNGHWLGLAGTDHYSIWSVGDWQRKGNYERDEPTYAHGTLAFAGKDDLLAVASTRQNIQLRSAVSEEKFFDLIGPEPQSVNAVRMALDGSVLVTATGNDMVQVWCLDRLQHELAGLNLEWQGPSASGTAPAATPGTAAGGLRTTLALSLAGVVVAGIFAVLILRQHRLSIARFISAEAETSQRDRELDIAKVELMHSQKMQALGTLATGIAHDFNNLLSVVRMSNKLIGRQAPGDAEIQEHVTDIEQAVLQGKGLIRSVLGYARTKTDDGEATDVNALVIEAVSLLSREFLSGIKLTMDLERNAPKVTVGLGPIEQVLLNLLVNASEAMQGEGRLKIITHSRQSLHPRSYFLRPHQAGQYVELSVIDSGPGIAPEIRDRLFEPFFTTKRSGSKAGTGLGLSTVYAIAEQWGLGLSAESEPGKGAVFTLVIPVGAPPVRETHTVNSSNGG
jgi:signal transduction histidine kinase